MKNAMLEAFELKRQGFYKQAIEVYYKIMSNSGCDVEILAELADLYFLLGNNERASHYVKKAFEIAPEHIGASRVMRKIYISERRLEKAENIALKIYEQTHSTGDLYELIAVLEIFRKYDVIVNYTKKTDDEECLYKRACALYNLKKYNDAESVLKSIISSDTNKNEKYSGLLGKIYYECGYGEKAREVFEKLEMNNTENAQNLNYIGLNKLDELNIEDAVVYFEKAVDKEPQNPEYHFNLAQAYFLKGWIDEAKKCFNTAICLNPENENYHYSLAYLLYRTGDYENAMIHLNPDHFESKILMQIIKSEQGNLALPKLELERMLEDNPENELILFALANICFKLDLFKQAKPLIEKAAGINPKSFEYQSFLVKILIKLKMFDEADKKIKELIQKYPKYYFAKVMEAELNLECKDFDALFESAQDLIELDINHYEGYYYNACALFENDDINFAIESLKKAISLDVGNAYLYVKMSEFYQALGRYEDAMAYIKEASDIDRSEKNKELYMQLAYVIRHNGIEYVKKSE